MTKDLEQAFDEVDHELSPEWIDLSTSLRQRVADLNVKAASAGLSDEATAVSREANRLCDHLERLHADVLDLLTRMDERLPARVPDFASPEDRPKTDEVQEEAIKIQRETHEMRGDFKDVLKALFMWRDDPTDRVKEKHDPASGD